MRKLDVSPIDVVRVLFPLLDAQFSFGYGMAFDPSGHVIRLPGGIIEVGWITAPALLNRIMTAIDQCKDSDRSQILNNFLLVGFSIAEESEGPTERGIFRHGIQVFLRSTRASVDVGPEALFEHVRRIFSYGFYRLPKARHAIGYSDYVYGKTAEARPVMFESCPYQVEFLRGALETLRRRFDFLQWNELRIFGLAPSDLLSVTDVLASSSYRVGNCICIPKNVLKKKLKMRTGRTSGEIARWIESLCKRGQWYADAPVDSKINVTPPEDRDWESTSPLLEVKGFVATSLWFLHCLTIQEIHRRSEMFPTQRGRSMEAFLEESLRDYSFSTLRSLKWIKLVPEIEGRSRLEINVLAYKKGVLLQIQCKSYS